MKEIKDINELDFYDDNILILSYGFADRHKDELPINKYEALKNDKGVFLNGYWCVLGKLLPKL